MSVTSKKRRARLRADEAKGGVFPSIEIGVSELGTGLWWKYRVAPNECALCVPFDDVNDDLCPFLVVDGESFSLDGEQVQREAEQKFGAMTRLSLMLFRAQEIKNSSSPDIHLTQLRQSAVDLGIYGKREPIRPIIIIN